MKAKTVYESPPEVDKLLKQAAADRKKTAKIQKKIAAVKDENDQMLKERGWWGITDDEFAWLTKNYKKEFHFFQPTLEMIKQRYAERTGSKIEQPKEKDPWVNDANGWINSAGTYFPTGGFARHNDWAYAYLNDKYGVDETERLIANLGRNKTAYEYLESVGWARIMAWEKVGTKFILPKKLTHAQKQTIDKYCDFYNEPLPFDDPLFNK